MDISRDILHKLINSCQTGDLADFISKELKIIQDIERSVSSIDRKIEDEKKKSSQKIKDLEKERADVQKTCKHIDLKHYRGHELSDSYSKCKICGWEEDNTPVGGYDG